MNAIHSAPGLMPGIRAFLVLAEKTLRTKLAYRTATLVSLAVNAAAYGIYLLVWSEVYRANPQGHLVSREVMMPYLVVAFVVNFALSMTVEMRFLMRLRMGLVTSDLIRPMGFLPFQAAQGLGDIAGNFILVLPVYAVGWWFLKDGIYAAGPQAAALAAASLGLAFVVNFAFSYLLMQLGFITMSLYGVWFMRMSLHQIFSGLAAPLVMFPPALGAVAHWLPFRHVVETPTLIWLGQATGWDAVSLLAQQAAWGAVMLCLGALVFHWVLSRHQVQGG
jgi:ABC-2 type transport system permease protein